MLCASLVIDDALNDCTGVGSVLLDATPCHATDSCVLEYLGSTNTKYEHEQ